VREEEHLRTGGRKSPRTNLVDVDADADVGSLLARGRKWALWRHTGVLGGFGRSFFNCRRLLSTKCL